MASYTVRGFYIPKRMMDGISMYINHKIKPGGFLRAVISNNLKDAVGMADDENLANLPAYVSYFYNEAPSDCWGSEEKLNAWIMSRKEAA